MRDQQVQLAALTAPITSITSANNPQAVHVLAEVSRAFQSAKIANATSAVGATAASPSVARTKAAQPAAAAAIPSQAKAAQTGAVTTQDPETADTPDATGGQSLTPRSAAVNALDPSGVANVLASAAQLALDIYVRCPPHHRIHGVQLRDFLGDVAALNPYAISHFGLLNEGDSFQRFGDVAADIISGDVNQLQTRSMGCLASITPTRVSRPRRRSPSPAPQRQARCPEPSTIRQQRSNRVLIPAPKEL